MGYDRQVKLATPLGEDALLLRRMHGREELGRLFQFELDLLSDRQIVATDLLGQSMTVHLSLPNARTRHFHGYVSRFAGLGQEGRYLHYNATLRPWLWLLTRTSNCRIFQNLSVPDILKQVFRKHGLTDFDDQALSSHYPSCEYVVQYHETDFGFVSRLMERVGIYHFFRHDVDKHTLVLSDSQSGHERSAGYEEVSYLPPEQGDRGQEHIHAWRVSHQIQPGAFVVDAHDFKRPNASLRVRLAASASYPKADFEMYDYPGPYEQTTDGDTYARVRLEELQAQHEQLEGEANARGLCAGALFKLVDYPVDVHNREYLITRASYVIENNEYESGAGAAATTYQCSLSAIDSHVPYRVARVTPKPVIAGPQTAVVVGKAGEEIWTDEYGRVRVQFRWDRDGKFDENSSCWVRVAQIWAGSGWGAQFVPRIGQEVIVEFLDGDPDRPIIIGSVYNANQMPAYELPQHQAQSGIKTRSTKDGNPDNANELRFDDTKGAEQIFIHGHKNLDVRVGEDRYEFIGRDAHEIVTQDRMTRVDNERHTKVGADDMTEVGKDHHLSVKGKQAIKIAESHSLTVAGDVIESFRGKHSTQVTQTYQLKAMGVVIEATAGITLKCGASHITLDASGVTVKGPMVVLDGAMVRIASGPGSPPLSGSAATPVPPASPREPFEADEADPGKVAKLKAEQAETAKGKYGAARSQPWKPANAADQEPSDTAKPKTWIEIELVDEHGKPVPGEPYEITLADGTHLTRGTLDPKGLARIEGIDPGTCKVSFPRLDKDAWKPA